MSYDANRVVPDWKEIVSTLKDQLDDILLQIEQDEHMGARIDAIALNAFDTLDRYLSAIKSDLGI